MMKKLVVSLFISCLLNNIVNAQHLAVSRSLYALYCVSNLDNGRPIQVCLLRNEFAGLFDITAKVDQHNFMCKLLGSSIIMSEPAFTLGKTVPWLNLKNKKEEMSYRILTEKRLQKLYKSFSSPIKIPFTNHKKLRVQIVEIDAAFWEEKDDLQEYQEDKGNFDITSDCYKKDYLYYLKEIIRITKVNDQDLKRRKS